MRARLVRGWVAAGMLAGALVIGVWLGDANAEEKTIHRRSIEGEVELTDEQKLGMRLFDDIRFGNPGSDVSVSCRTCHVPNENYKGERAYTDSVARSIMPSRGGRDLTLRNTPTLLDVASMSSYYWDGRFDSVESLVEEKILGAQFGWGVDERDSALNEIHAMLVGDTGVSERANGTYLEEFKRVYETDLDATEPEAAMKLLAKALAAYVNTLHTTETAPYDAFAYLNRANTGFADNDTPEEFSGRLFGLLGNQEGRLSVKWPKPYDEVAYQGLKTFFRVPGEEMTEAKIGNCVVCHHPPRFSDFNFHNTGVAQMEYDGVHGDGAFEKLEVDASKRGDAQYLSRPNADDPGLADLGHWNFAAEGEGALGAFKTPGLRNLSKTDPYMHNGAYETLEDVIRQKIRASELAKAGKLRNPHPALLTMSITESDIPELVAFLKTLDEVPPDGFRDVIVKNVDTRTILPE